MKSIGGVLQLLNFPVCPEPKHEDTAGDLQQRGDLGTIPGCAEDLLRDSDDVADNPV